MQSTFEFVTAGRIVFGRGCAAAQLAKAVSALGGRRILLVTGRNPARVAAVTENLPVAATLSVPGEPTIALAEEGVRIAREAGCDCVVAVGGGSAIDAGKAVAGVAASGGTVLSHCETIGGGAPIDAALPFVAVPTTAGTGSECTKNAVLCSPSHGVKVSIRSDAMLPRVAIVDPMLTLQVPQGITRDTGMDALLQCIEPFVCNARNPVTDALCREGIVRAARSLRVAVRSGDNVEAREDMCISATLSGMCLANARLGLVHGFAGPLGGMLQGAPHGALCAAVAAHVTRANIAAASAAGDGATCARYAEIARLVGAGDSAESCAEWLASLCKDLAVPTLSQLGLTREMVPALVEKVARASSTRGNPVTLAPEQLEAIALAAL